MVRKSKYQVCVKCSTDGEYPNNDHKHETTIFLLVLLNAWIRTVLYYLGIDENTGGLRQIYFVETVRLFLQISMNPLIESLFKFVEIC